MPNWRSMAIARTGGRKVPQPDGTLVAFPKSPVRRPRDPRIDTFRGLALLMILVDHIPGNPYEILTLRNFGFSDAAEAFFVMSGIAAGIAYSGAMQRWSAGEVRLWPAISPFWGRAWTLYLVQIFLTVAALALYAWAADTFLRAGLRSEHNVGLVFEQTGAALSGLATLRYQIGYVNILPAYILLMLAAPLAVWGGLRAPWITLGVSGGLWFVAGWQGWNVPNHPGGGGWFFSPFTWQAIFVLGLVIGIRHRQGRRLVPVSRPLFWLCAAFLALTLAWSRVPELAAYLNHKMAELGALGAPANVVSHNKTYLALPRLLHVLALIYAVSCLPAVTRACAHPAAAPLRLLGRQGLLVFAAGTVLALAAQIALEVEPGSPWLPWLLPLVAAAIVYAMAWSRDRLGKSAAPAAGGIPASAAQDPPREAAGRG